MAEHTLIFYSTVALLGPVLALAILVEGGLQIVARRSRSWGSVATVLLVVTTALLEVICLHAMSTGHTQGGDWPALLVLAVMGLEAAILFAARPWIDEAART
jgi:hypothetical protein